MRGWVALLIAVPGTEYVRIFFPRALGDSSLQTDGAFVIRLEFCLETLALCLVRNAIFCDNVHHVTQVTSVTG